MDRSELRRKVLLIIYVAGLTSISLYAFLFFVINRVYLIGSDAFYYMSIGDSILQIGSALDMTSIPAQPLKTTQNGVVFFHLLFAQLGVGPEGRLLCIAILNYVLHVSAVYPLYKIAYRVGLPRGGPMAALLAHLDWSGVTKTLSDQFFWGSLMYPADSRRSKNPLHTMSRKAPLG